MPLVLESQDGLQDLSWLLQEWIRSQTKKELMLIVAPYPGSLGMLLSSWLMNRASPQKFSGLYLASLALAEQEELVVRARSTLGALTKLSPLRNQFLGLY